MVFSDMVVWIAAAERFDSDGFGTDAGVQFGGFDTSSCYSLIVHDAVKEFVAERFLQSNVTLVGNVSNDAGKIGVTVNLIEIVAVGRAVAQGNPDFYGNQDGLSVAVLFCMGADFHLDAEILKDDAAAGKTKSLKQGRHGNFSTMNGRSRKPPSLKALQCGNALDFSNFGLHYGPDDLRAMACPVWARSFARRH